MEDIFKKIENNIFESQQEEENSLNQKNNDLSDDTTEDTSKPRKIKIFPKTETKNFKILDLSLENNENEENIDEDEYADYAKVNKTGIHFQIISDLNVSIEIVPDDLLRKDVKELILKYKGVFDSNMNLWLVPYSNYELLYNELNQIEGINKKLRKVGSIAKECYQNKKLTTLIFKRKEKEEKINYTNDDTLERKVDALPQKLRNALYDFQIEGVKFGIEHHCRFLLADEMGVGKTIQAISLAYIYRDSWPVLIVCPGSMKYLWKGEIQTWLGLKDHRINMLNRSKQKISKEAYFYIISYDLVRNILKKLRKMTFDFVILDEAHSIKNKDSLRAKNILPIAIRAKRLILMTGTPLLAKPLEGYPLLYALRPDLFPYFKRYAYRYCDPQPTPFGISWSGTSNTKELHWILSTLMVRRLKRDVLNKLPPKRRQKILIETDPNVISEIKEVRTKIKGRTGTLEAYTLTARAKKEGVCEYISDILETGEKIIVFAYHHEMLDRIQSLMEKKNIDFIRIDGSTKQDKRYEYVTYFQKYKSCKVAILSIIAASTGITLNSAHIVIFAELTWTPSIMIQAEDRAHRIGQKSEFVDIKYLCGQETLDDFILDKLQKKIVIVSTTIDDKKENFGVKADPNLIHPEGKNSKELIRIAKGEFNFSDDDSDNENEEDSDDDQNIEKKILKDLEFELENKDNSDENNNKNKNDKKKNKKGKDNNYNIENNEFRYPKPEDDLDLNVNDIDLDLEAINNKINELESKEIKNHKNYSAQKNYFNINNNNINEFGKTEDKYPKSEIKLNQNSSFGSQIKNNELKNKDIIYPKKVNEINPFIENSININKLNRKAINYSKEENKINNNNNNYNTNKESIPNILKNKKIYYPKKEKRESTTDGKIQHKKKLSAIKALRKIWSTNNKAKSTDKLRKKNNINEDKKENINVSNIFQGIINNENLNIDKEANNSQNYYIEKKNNKESENINDLNANYEKGLMVNLHKVNMRRTISDEETKQSQTYDFKLDDKKKEKYKSEKKNFIFTNKRKSINKNYD